MPNYLAYSSKQQQETEMYGKCLVSQWRERKTIYPHFHFINFVLGSTEEKSFLVSDPTNCAKNVNWLALQGMPQAEAKEKYVELVDDLMKKYCVVFPSSRYGSMASLASVSTTYSYVPSAKKD